MADLINLKNKFNHRWKTDPKFIKGFDYDNPKYADVPVGLKWALPIHESVNSPAEIQRSKRLQEKVSTKSSVEEKVKRPTLVR